MENKKNGNIKTVGERLGITAIHLSFIIICVFTLALFLIVVGVSFQSQREIDLIGYRLIPKSFSLEAYRNIFNRPKTMLDSYKITIITTLIGTVMGVMFCAGYAYAMSRKDFAYRKILTWANLISMLFNGGLVASYIVYTRWFGLKNNIWVLIFPLMFSPWNVVLMKSFFMSLPESILEAAKIDGAGEYRIFFGFVIPISKPIIATIALFMTLSYWNDYQMSLIYTTKESLYKLQYLLMRILSDMQFLNSAAAEMGVNMNNVEIPTSNLRMAMCVLAAGPILFVFPFFQKYFAKGVTLGGVKG